MLIITETTTINTNLIAVICYNQVSDNNFYIYCDNNIVIGHLSEHIAKTLYDDIIYSMTSGKKSYNVAAHLSKILERYSYREVVL